MNNEEDYRSLPKWIEHNVPEELTSSSLFRFDVTLQVADPEDPTKKKKITVDVLNDLEIEMEVLEEQMQDIPAQYMFWSSVYSELRLAVAVAERNLKVRRGKATQFVQKEASDNGVKISVEQLKVIVEQDKNLTDADLRLAKAQMVAGKIWHMLRAVEMKHEICRSLMGLKKAEFDKTN
jgi:hypothetical protein